MSSFMGKGKRVCFNLLFSGKHSFKSNFFPPEKRKKRDLLFFIKKIPVNGKNMGGKAVPFYLKNLFQLEIVGNDFGINGKSASGFFNRQKGKMVFSAGKIKPYGI